MITRGVLRCQWLFAGIVLAVDRSKMDKSRVAYQGSILSYHTAESTVVDIVNGEGSNVCYLGLIRRRAREIGWCRVDR